MRLSDSKSPLRFHERASGVKRVWPGAAAGFALLLVAASVSHAAGPPPTIPLSPIVYKGAESNIDLSPITYRGADPIIPISTIKYSGLTAGPVDPGDIPLRPAGTGDGSAPPPIDPSKARGAIEKTEGGGDVRFGAHLVEKEPAEPLPGLKKPKYALVPDRSVPDPRDAISRQQGGGAAGGSGETEPLPQGTAGEAEIAVTKIAIEPSPPREGDSVRLLIALKNSGSAASGVDHPFTATCKVVTGEGRCPFRASASRTIGKPIAPNASVTVRMKGKRTAEEGSCAVTVTPEPGEKMSTTFEVLPRLNLPKDKALAPAPEENTQPKVPLQRQKVQ